MGITTNADSLTTAEMESLLGSFQSNAFPSIVADLADRLRVTPDSIRRLAPGWCICAPFKNKETGEIRWGYQGWFAFAERDAKGHLTAIGLRGQDGHKLMYPGGGHRGLVFELNPDYVEQEEQDAADTNGPDWVHPSPCPVCGNPDPTQWCATASNGAVCWCHRKKEGSIRTRTDKDECHLHILIPELYRGNQKPASALADNGGPVVVVEGASDTLAAMDLGFNAVGKPSALGSIDELCKLLAKRPVIVMGEHDRKKDGTWPGKVGAEKTAEALAKAGCSVTLVFPPPEFEKDGTPKKVDLRSWYSGNTGLPRLNRQQFDTWVKENGQKMDAPGSLAGLTKLDAALRIASEDVLSHDASKTPFATFITSTGVGSEILTRPETVLVNSPEYVLHLEYMAHIAGLTLTETAKKEAVQRQSAKARWDSPERTVFLRHAFDEAGVYIDLVNPRGECVFISPHGVEVISNPKVLFRRTSGMLELPRPADGGDFSEFFDLIGLSNPDHRILVLAWLVACHHPTGPYWMLNLSAQQGSGKSIGAELLMGLIDPNAVPLMAPVENESELAAVGRGQWALAFDNVSSISPASSDMYCRVISSVGSKNRKLYTQDETVSYKGGVPIIMTSIGEVVTRPDLRQRALVVNLSPIPDEDRKTEAEIRREFQRIRPRVLAALYRAASIGMSNLASVKLPRMPRMADAASFVVAAEPALPWAAGEFLRVLNDDAQAACETALEDSAIGPAILKLMRGRREWSGAVNDLLAEVDRLADPAVRVRADFPRNPRSMANAIERIRPALAASGILVDRLPRRNDGRRICLRHAGA